MLDNPIIENIVECHFDHSNDGINKSEQVNHNSLNVQKLAAVKIMVEGIVKQLHSRHVEISRLSHQLSTLRGQIKMIKLEMKSSNEASIDSKLM